MFEVDKQGLAKLLERKGKRFVPLELLQNALDETGVTRVDVTIEPATDRGHYRVRVADDAPNGFHDLSHAYTLFAESKKKTSATKRGRWNLGEKLVIACCIRAEIKTTTGTIVFADEQREHSRAHTAAGSIFTGDVRMTHQEAQEAVEAARSVLVPPGIRLTVNGKAVDCREPLSGTLLTLQTEIADAEGFMRRSARETELRVFQVAPGEVASIYELGIPVVEVECDWHIDIGQKVPLNLDRDNVTPAYRRAVLTAVVNLMHERLDQDTAAKPWVGEALASPEIHKAAVHSIVTAKHGDRRVSYDPSDAEGSKIAVTQGFEVVHGGNYTRPQWENIRRAEAILPAGQVTPSPKPFKAGGEDLVVLPESGWNDFHRYFVTYAQRVAQELIGREVRVVLANDPGWGFAGAYGSGTLTVNIVGRAWFAGRDSLNASLQEIDRLLIHEYAHDKVSDHLSEGFHRECCVLGARLVDAVRQGRINYINWT